MPAVEFVVEATEPVRPTGLTGLPYPGVFIQRKKRSSMYRNNSSNSGSCSSVDSLEAPGATDSPGQPGMGGSPMSSESQSLPARQVLPVPGQCALQPELDTSQMEPSAKLSFVGQQSSKPRTYTPNPEQALSPPSRPVPAQAFHSGCRFPPYTLCPPVRSVPADAAAPAAPPPARLAQRFLTASQRTQQLDPTAGPFHTHSPYCAPAPQGTGPLQTPLPHPPPLPPHNAYPRFPPAPEPHSSPVVSPPVGLHPSAPHLVLQPPAYARPPPPSPAPSAALPCANPPDAAVLRRTPTAPHSRQLLDSLAQLHASAAFAEGATPVSPTLSQQSAPSDQTIPATVPEPFSEEVVMLQKVMENRNAPDEKAAVDPRKYKTRLCRNWLERGECLYAHTCCFAHGPEELRTLVDNHKTLASIGYFSNVVLLAMTNGKRPALAPHSLYQQPPVFSTPTTARALQEYAASVPPEWAFPFRDPLPAALMDLREDAPAKPSAHRKGHRGKFHRTRGRRAVAATSEGDAKNCERTA